MIRMKPKKESNIHNFQYSTNHEVLWPIAEEADKPSISKKRISSSSSSSTKKKTTSLIVQPPGLRASDPLLDYFAAKSRNLPTYIAAEITAEINDSFDFVLGDNKTYGGYRNAPLTTGHEYQVSSCSFVHKLL